MEGFFLSLKLPPPDTFEFVQTGHGWVLGVQYISDGAAHSDLVISKNVSIYPGKVLFSLEAEQTVICSTKQPGWPFIRDCTHCCSAMFQFLV